MQSFFYSYSVIACTSEGCITSPPANITTLEAPPATVEAPTVESITSNSLSISWSKPPTQNGAVTKYVLKVNKKDAYQGTDLNAVLSGLQPHTSYQLVLLACTSGGCTASNATFTATAEAPPTDLSAPTLKVGFFPIFSSHEAFATFGVRCLNLWISFIVLKKFHSSRKTNFTQIT